MCEVRSSSIAEICFSEVGYTVSGMTRDDSVFSICELASKCACVVVCISLFISRTEDSIDWMRGESAPADSRSGFETEVVALNSSREFLLL